MRKHHIWVIFKPVIWKYYYYVEKMENSFFLYYTKLRFATSFSPGENYSILNLLVKPQKRCQPAYTVRHEGTQIVLLGGVNWKKKRLDFFNQSDRSKFRFCSQSVHQTQAQRVVVKRGEGKRQTKLNLLRFDSVQIKCNQVCISMLLSGQVCWHFERCDFVPYLTSNNSFAFKLSWISIHISKIITQTRSILMAQKKMQHMTSLFFSRTARWQESICRWWLEYF